MKKAVLYTALLLVVVTAGQHVPLPGVTFDAIMDAQGIDACNDPLLGLICEGGGGPVTPDPSTINQFILSGAAFISIMFGLFVRRR